MNILTGSPKDFKGGCVLAVKPDGIPESLKAERVWTPWKSVPRDGRKPAKVPIDVRTGRFLTDGFDPRKLVSFDEAFAYHLRNGLVGKGGVKFAFVGGRYAGLDLDECRDPLTGGIKPEAVAMLTRLGTYAEVSPSGTGVKAIGIGRLLADGGHVGKSGGLSVEVYDRVKWFAMTGHRLDFAPATVNECEAEMRRIQALVTKPKTMRVIPFTVNGIDSGGGFRGSDDELLRRAFASKCGPKIAGYWCGDLHGKKSASEALLGLAQLLAYWVGRGGYERLDRLMRQSALVEKSSHAWDEPHSGEWWGMKCVVRPAIDSCRSFYGEWADGKKPNHSHGKGATIVGQRGAAEMCNTASGPAAEKCNTVAADRPASPGEMCNTPPQFSQGSACADGGKEKCNQPGEEVVPTPCKRL